MKLTIGKKLIASFLALAALVLLSGSVGSIVVNKIAETENIVTREKMPLRYAVMQTALSLEKVEKQLIRLSESTSDLSDIEKLLYSHLDEVDMWISMIIAGTDSEAFRNSPAGKLFNEKKLQVQVPEGKGEILAIANTIRTLSTALRKTSEKLVHAHRESIHYSVQSGENTYPLTVFLNIIQREHQSWLKQLKDAVNIEDSFTGETDPQQGRMGGWLHNYQVNNAELMNLLEKMRKQYTKLLRAAERINKLPTQQAKYRVFRRTVRQTARIEQYFEKMRSIGTDLEKEIEAEEKQQLQDLALIADKINANLQKLIIHADQGMQSALALSRTVEKNGKKLLFILTASAVFLAVILGTYISRSISTNISRIAEATRRISSGDLRSKIEAASRDELGDLAADTNTMIDNLRRMIGQLKTTAVELGGSSGHLSDVARDLNTSAVSMNGKATAATETTRDLSGSMEEIATVADESMENINGVAQATQEMSATISQIAQSTETARAVTTEAVVTVDNTSLKINELGEAAREIGKVADVIVSIADQTNLLALNATIEAARAGEAGKGFAVVANEVKELAAQTNEATEDIRHKIQAIQRSSEMTIQEIREISTVMNKVNETVVKITDAIEEQAKTTREITGNVATVAGGIENMTSTVSTAARMTAQVSDNITRVNQTSDQVQNTSSQIEASSKTLAVLAGDLQQLVEQFRI